MKLLCDEMLQGLAKWLRAAGYDTLVADAETPDRNIVKQAKLEHRTLITRDRSLLQIRHASKVALLLQSNQLEDCVHELNQKLNINWQIAPFTRCTVCNTPLIAADDKALQKVPSDIPRNNTILYCSHCDKVYWEGSHVMKINKKLALFASL